MSWNSTASQRRWTFLTVAAGLLLAVTVGYSDEEQPAAAKPAAKPGDKAAQTEKKAAAKPADKKPPANPLSKLIRNIFGGRRLVPSGKLIPDATADDDKGKFIGNGDRTARDHIDTRAPFDSRQASRLRKARALMQDEHYKQAAEWLQRILDTTDDEEDSLVRLPDGKLRSVRQQANQLLGQFPADALDGYRREHGGFAEQRLRDARTRADLSGIVKVADKYFHTTAGYEASNYVGTLHVDRGEFGPAARRFLQLLEADAPVTHDPQWRMKAAFAFRQAGDADGSEKLLSTLASLPLGGLQVGGRDIDPAGWLNGLGVVAAAATPPLDEWLMIYGTPRRTGTAVGGDPLLLERWFSPLTHKQGIAEQIEILLEDLADQRRTTVPAWFPLTVDDKVVFRTMRGVQVVEAKTGKPLWETRAGVSPERVLTGQPVAQYAQIQGMVFPAGFNLVPFNNGMLGNFRSSSVDQHPLASLLFRDGTYGVLSSDGRRLFVIEDHAVLSSQQPGYYWGSRMNQNDQFRRDWSSNKIAAYDLFNGRPLWEVGGRETKEVFEPPLAGTYFFGAPTPDGRELFAVGEKDNEIRLFSLDPDTGDSKWFQLLAISETKIEEDYGRRWWTAQVAVGNGVLVCPTTVGWLVAVDRTSHAILWAYRYSQPVRNRKNNFNFNNRQTAVVPYSAFNQRWSPSAPIIVGNHVIYTPSEYTKPQSQQTSVICLNLFDGTRLWQKPKGTFRYLAGVFDERVVLVGTNSVTALSLDKGTTLWNRPISNADGRPSGFGVAVGNRYHLPLSSGQVWTIDLTNGSVLSKSTLPDGETRLGNLAMYRGMLLSLSPRGLTSFEQRDALVAEIRRRQQQNPQDAWALGREADIHMLNRDYSRALDVLNTIPPDQVEPNQVPHYRNQMMTCLAELVRSDFAKRERELDQLARFVQTPAEKLHFQRLSAERLDFLGRFAAAFDVYQQLAGEDRQLTIPRRSDPKVSLPLQQWIAGRLRDLWSRIPEDARTDLDQRIAAAAEQVVGESSAAQERFAVLFDFHPTSQRVRNRLVDWYANRGELARAEAHLERLSRADDEHVAAAALLRLARLMQERNLTADARFYFEQLTRRYAHVDVGDGTTASELYQQLQTDGAFPSAGKTDVADWGDFDLKLERIGSGYSSSQLQELRSSSFRLPYFRQFRYQIDQQQKLAVINLADGTLHWLVPLRGQSRSSSGYPVAQTAGHRLFVLHRDVLHCLSPLERKVLWIRSLQTRGPSNGNSYYRNRQNIRPMQSANSLISRQALTMRNAPTGMLAVANSNYVCVYGRRKFTVLDAATGEVRWTRSRVPANTKLVGSEDLLYMIPAQNRNQTTAFRSADGKPLPISNIGSLLARAVRVSNDGLVLIESRAGSSILGLSSTGSTTVRLYDPLLKKNRWRHSFPNGAYYSILDDGSLTVLRKDNTFALLNLDDGQLKELGKVAKTAVKSRSRIYTVADRDNVYLIANKSSRSGSNYSLGLAFVRVNGTVFAFDRHSGRQLWKQAVPKQNLVLSQFAHSPVMTFATRTYVRKGPLNYWTLGVVAIDKKSGRKLLNTTVPFNNSFRSVDVNLADRYVELRSYNDRIRLIAVDRKTSSAK